MNYDFFSDPLAQNYAKIAADYKTMTQPRMIPEIKNIIFHDPATIIYWVDGAKTVVKVHGEDYDPEKGFAMAVLKKLYGDHYYTGMVKKWASTPDEPKISTFEERLVSTMTTLKKAIGKTAFIGDIK